MLELLADALLDSLKIFAFVFVINFIFSFFEEKITKSNLKQNKASVLFAALLGLLPQCGLSVAASEKYKKNVISGGTLLAIFIATSDEAIPVLLSAPEKMYAILPLLSVKFLIAVIAGYLFDFIFRTDIQTVNSATNLPDDAENEQSAHEEAESCGCRHCRVRHDGFVKEHILHPLYHSLTVFVVILVLNVIFSLLVYFVTEEKINAFLHSNAVLAPLFSVLVGLIPNCASSVIISKMYISGSLSFGACVAGLIANSGLGITVLFGKNSNAKNNLKIITALIVTGLISGYLICLIAGF